MRMMLVGAVMLLACLSGSARADEASAVKAVEKLGGKGGEQLQVWKREKR